ncbi:MAG: phosphatidate cytidylyltransferase [Candidatus Andeanibacterium colombiense]|uniref:Phosphatidate cytidylyltransferase n=1 Tax=Candidatus Andeanibacterium colombiense TaxID=3121345 RepID=A0AAJ5X9U8_9SPHN|nr:MAG: phosphatidate cytidylyltransferase [Sphingomonadaceae bacterium]
MTDTLTRKSDLGTRTLTAIGMVVVAGGALWLGGWFWAVFVGLIAVGVLWEWRALVRGFVPTALKRMLWNVAGFIYIAVAAFTLLLLRSEFFGIAPVLVFVGAVICIDIGAYFAGRSIGGPKIAPKISPSKTWAGLGGGMVGAAIVLVLASYVTSQCYLGDAGSCGLTRPQDYLILVIQGAALAIVAQAGDFFESWMKRRAGVKDSGRLLPGHGGLFDRVDGLLAVSFAWGIVALAFRSMAF